VTGCLRIAKESIFTGLNHQDVHTVLTDEEREWFGFSSEEVQAALAARGAAGRYSDVQRWYDGYLFGRHEVYNPWSIMNFLASVTPARPDGRLTTYWANTSGNDILTRLLERAERRRTLAAAVEGLFDDVPVVCRVSETVTYADMLDRDDTLWSVMLFSGYLKPAAPIPDGAGADCRLRLPNREVRELLRDTVRAWLAHPTQPGRGGRLLDALVAGRVQEAQDLLTALLRATISYNDYSEDFYHAFLAGLLASVDSAQVLSNREAGDGRMDIGVLAGDGQTALVIELKVAPSFDRLGDRAREGLDQIDARRYDSAFSDLDGVVIRRYGVAFCRKACAVALADEA
ncbi:MAG: AAA family ATPase, partial [Oligosphaeraceae bacterium]